MTLTPDQRELLMRDAWFAALPERMRQALLAQAQMKRLPGGGLLHARGDVAEGFYVVLHGAIRISGSTEQGRLATLTYIEPGTWFGEIALLDGAQRTHDAWAVGDSQVLVVPAASFRALLAQQPEAALQMALLVSGKLRQAMAWIEDMSLQPLDSRLAQRLIDLHDKQTLGGAGQVELSQDDLASLVGASRQSVNREIKGWEARDWVVQRYGKLAIVNAAALRQLAQGISKDDVSA